MAVLQPGLLALSCCLCCFFPVTLSAHTTEDGPEKARQRKDVPRRVSLGQLLQVTKVSDPISACIASSAV